MASVSNALEAIMVFEPEVAVLDISMPSLTSLQVARELKKRFSKAEVVFLSDHKEMAILQS